jgi:hypothetical protein
VADDRRDLHPDVQEAGQRHRVNEALKFFTYAYDKGDDMAKALDYIPMPDNVVALVKKTWSTDIAQK